MAQFPLIQTIVDSLPVKNRIDVSCYYKFSSLMQKIMYEYGCYDNVFEICGNKAQQIRDQCVFPRSHTYNNKPLYLYKKLYYIDLNGAYMSAISSIPTGNNFDSCVASEEKNIKIKDLIETLYNIRKEAQTNNNNKH